MNASGTAPALLPALRICVTVICVFIVWQLLKALAEPAISREVQIGDIVALLAVCLSVIGFIVSLEQYRKSDQWKRSEWAAAEAARFAGQPRVRLALTLLDYSRRRVLLTESAAHSREAFVDDDAVYHALAPHESHSIFTRDQAILRDAFDEMFEGLARFQIFRERELIEDEDIVVHLAYWLEILNGERGGKSPEYRNRLWEFAEAYGYRGARTLAVELTRQQSGLITGANADPSIRRDVTSSAGKLQE